MSFFSLTFAVFLIGIFFIWWLLPQKARPFLLCAANLVFAAALGFWAFAMLGFITLLGYLGGLVLQKVPRGPLLFFGVLLLLAPLALYKYLPILPFAWAAPFSQLMAPLGLSFYTFKSISYLIEVKRGTIPAVKNPILFFGYIGFFPQLPMGPIQRPAPFFEALAGQPRHLDSALALNACTRICWALFLKKCLADPLSGFTQLLEWPDYGHSLGVVWSLAAYSLYLYFDFASYSQLAIAFGELLGLPCAENFKSPYFSRSIGEFWKRWHISLSSFLRDYIYIPLGGSRNGTAVLILATMVTFLLSGIWHGATAGFVVWGGMHGLFLLIGRATKKLRERFWAKTPDFCRGPVRSVLSWAFTMLLVAAGWFFFATRTLPQAAAIAQHLFQHMPLSVLYFKESLTQLNLFPPELLRLGIFGLVAALVDFKSLDTGFGPWAAKLRIPVRAVLCYFCIFAVLFFGASGSLPGIYFAF